MILPRKIAFFNFLIMAVVLFGMGSRMAFVDQLMPYHLDALAVPLASLPAGVQFMLLSFMHGFGIGAMSTSVALLVLLFGPYRDGQNWAPWAISGLAAMFFIPLAFLVHSVSENTAANPPLMMVFVALGLISLGTILSNVEASSKAEVA